ncbi:MAG TPA: 30S ribosomal protein S2 [Anaerolineae bacterium]|nr:30S ribosomal protein S2 [Anaerolineae bacterium]
MASILPMKSLLEAGVHFGHRTRRWNPRMKQFIFTQRNGIHIIDLQQTMQRLEEAYKVVRDSVAEGNTILFVGTKKQAQETVQQEATRCGMPYVSNRWLGGTLTNFRTIRSRIDYMLRLEERQAMGELDKLPKKEALLLTRELAKLESRLGGLREMKRLPRLLFIVDTLHEEIAIHEATALDIPIVALTDTNSDPFPIAYPIPANDDAIRAIKLITAKIADAVIEGKNIRGVVAAEQLEEGADAELQGELEQALIFEPGDSDLLVEETPEAVMDTATTEEAVEQGE